MRRAQLGVFRDFLNAAEDLGFTPAEYSVLKVIELNPGLKQVHVCEALGIKRANLVAMINGFEKKGIVKRRPSAHDKRSHALHLTKKGERVYAILEVRVRELNRRLAECLGEENRDDLLKLLQRIVDFYG